MGTASRTSSRNAAGKGTSAQSGAAPRGNAAGSAARNGGSDAPRPAIISMSSTDAKNGFGRVLDAVARGGRVLITKHNTVQAVVLSAAEYEELTRGPASELDALSAEFDDMLARMQTPAARAGLRDAFRASPDELSRAAVAAAR